MRDVRDQLANLRKRLKERTESAEIIEQIQNFEKQMTAIEDALHQTKAKSSQDVLNFPIRLNNKLVSLAGAASDGDRRPTDQALQVGEELTRQADAELAKWRVLVDSELPRLNALLAQKKVPGVFADSPADKKP